MEEKPYFCPKCRANRTKFRIIRRVVHQVKKDAFDGNIVTMGPEELFVTLQGEREVECQVCSFIGYEMMFIKAAEHEPRYKSEVRGRADY